MLHIVDEFGGGIDAHRKGRSELAEEARERGGGHILGSRSQHLQTARAVLLLHLGEHADRLLTVRAVRQNEGHHHGFALVLADADRLALADIDGEVRRGARQDGGARPGQRRAIEC